MSEVPLGSSSQRVSIHDEGKCDVSVQRHYADHRPYAEPPGRLEDLVGATSGRVELPVTIDWGPRRSYDMSTDADRRIAYERVLREAASTEELCRYLDGEALVDAWGQLFLPRRVREMWESRFPSLVRAA